MHKIHEVKENATKRQELEKELKSVTEIDANIVGKREELAKLQEKVTDCRKLWVKFSTQKEQLTTEKLNLQAQSLDLKQQNERLIKTKKQLQEHSCNLQLVN